MCGVPFEQIHFQISDLSNPLWTRIYHITDLRDLKTDYWITDPTRSLRAKDPKLVILPSSAQNFPRKFCELGLFRSQSVVNDKYSVNWHFSSYANYQCILSLLSFINCG